MTYFALLPQSAKSAIAGATFLALMSLLCAIIYTYINRKRTKSFYFNSVLFALSLVLVSLLSSASAANNNGFELNIPYFFLILFTAGLFIYSAFRIINEYKISRNSLSPLSVKQALDNLNSGICFSDENGRIVLINHIMSKLISSLTGSYPQTLEEIEAALKKAKAENDSEGTYHFNDGTVWKFKSLEISSPELSGFHQTYAQNISDLYEVNARLIEENEELKKTNEKTRIMLERLADRIREEETLKLKMQIHDDIGTSLIKISKIMQGDKEEDMAQQLSLLENAISFFSQNRATDSKTLSDTLNKADSMGVKLSISGELPKTEGANDLLFSAVYECLTNCVIHAKGNEVFVEINENGGSYLVDITNNGKAPDKPISEGGGLTSLRRKIEIAGGKMKIYSDEEFRLNIAIPKE